MRGFLPIASVAFWVHTDADRPLLVMVPGRDCLMWAGSRFLASRGSGGATMEIRSRRRHWIMVATATVNCIALGGVALVIASSSATAAPSAPVTPAASQATTAGSTDAAPKHCQVTLQSTTLFTAADGSYPFSRLTQSGDNFYGLTEGGVDGDTGQHYSPGGTFRLTDKGKLTTLDTFSEGGPNEGNFTNNPNAGLVADDGNLYGTTYSESGVGPVGTVFGMTPTGRITTIYTFASGSPPRDRSGQRSRRCPLRHDIRHRLQDHHKGQADHAARL